MSHLQHEDLSWIWIGDSEDARDHLLLKANNVRYVLNCTQTRANGGVSNFHEKDKSFEYCRLEMNDNATQQLDEHFEAAWEFIDRARIREDGAVLVHCQQGVSRSSSMIIAYLMKYWLFSFEDALALVQGAREISNPNEGFTQQLKELERHLKDTKGYEDVRPKKRRRVGGPQAGPVGAAGAPAGPSVRPQGPSAERQPVGPSIGPAGPPAARTAIGPAGPPTIGPSIGPAGPSAARPSIGPAGPPAMERKIGPSVSQPQPQSVGPSIGPSIGPAGPPERPSNGQTGSSAAGRKVGPSIGPTAPPAVGRKVGPSIGPARGPKVG